MHQELLENESASPLESQLREHLEAICASNVFSNSIALKSLLVYLFQNRNEKISEYRVAVEALNRRPDFDSKIDATVRAQIARLRKRLRDFYFYEGQSTDTRFSIPLGTHQLVVERIPSGVSLDESSAALHASEDNTEGHSQRMPTLRTDHSSRSLVLTCLVLVLAAICGWQSWKLRTQAQLLPPTIPHELLPFWKQVYANGKPIQIVIPNPAFFEWSYQLGTS